MNMSIMCSYVINIPRYIKFISFQICNRYLYNYTLYYRTNLLKRSKEINSINLTLPGWLQQPICTKYFGSLTVQLTTIFTAWNFSFQKESVANAAVQTKMMGSVKGLNFVYNLQRDQQTYSHRVYFIHAQLQKINLR